MKNIVKISLGIILGLASAAQGMNEANNQITSSQLNLIDEQNLEQAYLDLIDPFNYENKSQSLITDRLRLRPVFENHTTTSALLLHQKSWNPTKQNLLTLFNNIAQDRHFSANFKEEVGAYYKNPIHNLQRANRTLKTLKTNADIDSKRFLKWFIPTALLGVFNIYTWHKAFKLDSIILCATGMVGVLSNLFIGIYANDARIRKNFWQNKSKNYEKEIVNSLKEILKTKQQAAVVATHLKQISADNMKQRFK